MMTTKDMIDAEFNSHDCSYRIFKLDADGHTPDDSHFIAHDYSIHNALISVFNIVDNDDEIDYDKIAIRKYVCAPEDHRLVPAWGSHDELIRFGSDGTPYAIGDNASKGLDYDREHGEKFRFVLEHDYWIYSRYDRDFRSDVVDSGICDSISTAKSYYDFCFTPDCGDEIEYCCVRIKYYNEDGDDFDDPVAVSEYYI